MNELATNIDRATTLLEQTKGLSLQRGIPDNYAMVFPNVNGTVPVHMVGVLEPLDALWLNDGIVSKVETLRPWRGFGYATADTLVELPAGACSDVTVGDIVVVDEETVRHESRDG